MKKTIKYSKSWRSQQKTIFLPRSHRNFQIIKKYNLWIATTACVLKRFESEKYESRHNFLWSGIISFPLFSELLTGVNHYQWRFTEAWLMSLCCKWSYDSLHFRGEKLPSPGDSNLLHRTKDVGSVSYWWQRVSGRGGWTKKKQFLPLAHMHKYMYGTPYVKTTSNDILAGCRVNILFLQTNTHPFSVYYWKI